MSKKDEFTFSPFCNETSSKIAKAMRGDEAFELAALLQADYMSERIPGSEKLYIVAYGRGNSGSLNWGCVLADVNQMIDRCYTIIQVIDGKYSLYRETSADKGIIMLYRQGLQVIEKHNVK